MRFGRTFVLILLNICFSVIAKSPPLVLKHADFNENSVVNGKLITRLNGNVVFEYENAVIEADFMEWRRNDGKAKFRKNISIKNEGQFLFCNDFDFNQREKIAVLTGKVFFYDSTKNICITSNHAVYNLSTKYLQLKKDPRFYKYSKTSSDTMTISGKEMSWNDSLNKVSVLKNVEIHRGDLNATCKYAHFYTKKNYAELRDNPKIFFENQKLYGDSIDLFFVDDRVNGISVDGNAHGDYKEYRDDDTIITNLTSDSLYISISDSNTFDTVWACNQATAFYYSQKESNKKNEASGKFMVLSFSREGSVKDLEIIHNAQSTYYIEENNNYSRNDASGDHINVKFNNGQVAFLKLIGSVRGIYFSDNKK